MPCVREIEIELEEDFVDALEYNSDLGLKGKDNA